MTSLPKIARFAEKKNLACREYPFIITPNPGDSSYSESADILFRISAGDDKSRLRCIYGPATYGSMIITVTNGSGANAYCRLDGSSSALFQRITTNGPGGVLEEFNKPNIYIPCVFDLNVSPLSRVNYWSVFGNNYLPQNEDKTYAAGAANANSLVLDTETNDIAINIANAFGVADVKSTLALLATQLQTDRKFLNSDVRMGYKFNDGLHIANGGTSSAALSFILPSILGQFSKKLFPISELSQSSLDITLMTETASKALISTIAATGAAGTFTYSLTKLRLNLSMVEFNDVITSVIRNSYNSSYMIPCNSIQHFSQNITATTAGSFTLSFNATLQNAKGILFAFIDADNNVTQYPSLTGRTSLGITQAQLTIGPYNFPANRFLSYDGTTAMASLVQHPNYFLSAMKYFGNHIDSEMTCSTNIREFNTCGALANGSFVLAFSLEGIHEQDDEFRSTIPLDGYTTFLNFTTGVNAASATTVHAFILYEFDVVIQAGVAIAMNKLTAMNGTTLYK